MTRDDNSGAGPGAPNATAWALLVFVGMAAALLVLSWPRIAAMTYEWGDFASNSLLVQQAKSFRLFHGNYSRVGFYHPGPAILYVLAAGEALLHDALGLTSPIGGQRVAVIVYNSAWTGLTAAMFIRLFGRVTSGLIATGVLLAATLYYLPEVFTGLWFPDLYYFPFVTFSVALGLAVRGDARHLMVLALSMGFLIDGHVAFSAITVVMIAVGLVANAGLARVGAIPIDGCWWSRAFLARNGRRIAGAAALGILFLVPLAIDAILHYPGQIPAYFAYKAGHVGNDMTESLKFASSYLGPLPAAAMVGAAAIVLALRLREPKGRDGGSVALLASLLGATVATVLYARVGIDDLSETYIAYYFYAVPALALAGAAACLAKALKGSVRVAALVAVLVATAAFAPARLGRSIAYEYSFDIKHIPELYREVTALGPNLALDLDTSPEGNRWSKVWFNIAGLQAYASRLGTKPFCIANHWHIVFSPEYRCTDRELATDRRLLVMADAAPRPDFKTVLEDHDLSFVDNSGTENEIGRILRVVDNRQIFSAGILGSGWSDVENASVWSVGGVATLRLRAPAGAHRLRLDLDAFTPNGHIQTVFVAVDGGAERELVFDGQRGRRWESFDLPQGAGNDHIVTLRIADPLSPEQAGLSADGRRLGVLLFALAFD